MPDPTPPTVTLVSPEGVATDVPASQASAYADRGFTPQTVGQRAESNVKATVAEHTSAAKAAGYAFARGVTGGASDLLLNDDQKIDAQDAEEAHGTVSLLGNIAGAVVTGGLGAGALGEHVAEGLGGRLIGKTVGGVVEGGVYGAQQGLSEAALSDDPLTAENLIGHISSNVALGGGLGGGLSLLSHGVGQVLERAGGAMREAGAAKGALATVPEDLAKMDAEALKAEAKTAAAAHAADKEAEKASLESLRVDKRAELANEIRDMHTELSTERPIYQAVTGSDVEAIEGVKDIKVQLAKSFKTMRSGLDSEISVARDPSSLIRPLEMRQAALEKLQAKAPEISVALNGDARAAALDHVDAALEQTKQQIDNIRSLSKANPVASNRLTVLEAGPSQRMEQVAAAQKALADGKQLGVIGQKAKSIASTAAAGMAHMLPIPGASFAAHFMGEKAGSMVEWLGKKLSGTATKTADATAGHVSTFLDTAAKAPRALKGPAMVTATKTLSSTRFGAEQAAASDKDLKALFKARSAEIRSQTMYAPQPDGTTGVVMRPEARAAMAKTFDGLRVASPGLADKLETVAARRVAVQSKALPRKPDAPAGPQIGPDNWSPPDLEIRKWARIVRATEDPESVEQGLAHGIMTPEEAKAYREVYPERFAKLQQQIFAALPTLTKTLPMRKKVALSVFTGIPLIPALQPNVLAVTQAIYAVEPGSDGGTQAPKPQPNFGALGSLRDMDKPTASQQRSSK